jgi:hypothetical protein
MGKELFLKAKIVNGTANVTGPCMSEMLVGIF